MLLSEESIRDGLEGRIVFGAGERWNERLDGSVNEIKGKKYKRRKIRKRVRTNDRLG